MASYSFLNNDNNSVPLSQVDEEICAFVNRPVDSEHYCPQYHFVVSVGMVASRSTGYVTEASLDTVINEHPDMFNEDECRVAKEFLVTRYVFSSWA